VWTTKPIVQVRLQRSLILRHRRQGGLIGYDAAMSFIETLGGWPAVVGYVLGVLGILATIVAYFRAKVVKTVDYDPILSSSLIPTLTSAPDVEVRVDGDVVEKPGVCVVRILNSGRTAVDGHEWQGPLRIALDADFRKVSVADRSSPEVALSPHWAYESGSKREANITNVGLLNPGEWLDLQFITEEVATKVECRARFTGQTRPMREYAPYKVPETLGQLALQALQLAVRGVIRI